MSSGRRTRADPGAPPSIRARRRPVAHLVARSSAFRRPVPRRAGREGVPRTVAWTSAYSRGVQPSPPRAAFFKGLTTTPNAAVMQGSHRSDAIPTDGPREFHAAICGACGGQAVVPFAPRNDRPIYCSACFDKVRQADAAVGHRLATTPTQEAASSRGAGRNGPASCHHRPLVSSREGSRGRHHHPGHGRHQSALVERRGSPGGRDRIQDRPQHPDGRRREVVGRSSRMARSSSTASRSRSASNTTAKAGEQGIAGAKGRRRIEG